MGIFDSLFNFSSNAISAQQTYQNQRKLNQQQYDLTQQGYRESPANQRKGLESAGYNPLLAVNNGMSYGNYSAGSAQMQGNPASDIDGSVTNAYRAFRLERDKNKAEISNLTASENSMNADAAFKKEQALTEVAKRTQMDFQNAMYDVQKHLMDKDLSWYDRKAYAQVYQQMQSAEDYRASAAIRRFNAETDRMNAFSNAKNASANMQSASAKTLSQYAGKWVEDKLQSFKGSRFGRDLSTLGHKFYKR